MATDNQSALRVALLTGSGTRRVGWHVASALADRGYALAIHYRTLAAQAQQSVAEFRSRGVEAEAFGANLADEEAVKRLVAQTLPRFGRIDLLVNAAATWQPKRLEDVTPADVRGYFEAN